MYRADQKKRGTAMFGVGKAEKIANFQVCDVNGKRWTLLLSKELSGKILKDLWDHITTCLCMQTQNWNWSLIQLLYNLALLPPHYLDRYERVIGIRKNWLRNG